MRKRSVKSLFSAYENNNNDNTWDFNSDVDDNDNDMSDIYSTDEDCNNNNNTNTNTNIDIPNKEIESKNNTNEMSKEEKAPNDNPINKPLVSQHNYSSTQHSIISRLSPLVSPMNKYSGQYSYQSTNKIKLPLPNIIKLNIGGNIFSTTLITLRKYDSMLSKKFSGDYDAEYDHETDSYFIDRDGQHFKYILNYLRNGKFIIEKATNNSEKSQLFYQQLYEEVCYYQIDPLINILNPQNIYFYSTILPNQLYVKILKKWIANPTANISGNLSQSTEFDLNNIQIDANDESKEIINTQIRHNQKWNLIYRASDNGYSASQFHSHCDLHGSTITLIYANNRIFGGYTDISWKSDQKDKYVATKQECINTFIFVMNYTNKLSDLKAFKWNYNEKCYSNYGSNLPVVHESHIGPSFGWYHILKKRNNELNNINNISNEINNMNNINNITQDGIIIGDNCNVENNSCWTYCAYFNTPKTAKDLAGSKYFFVKDIEVYQISFDQS